MSPGKVKYFNAVMHNGHEELNIVSYNERLHGTMEAARSKDKPLKFEQFCEHHDEFKNQKVLKLHEGTAVSYSKANIPFDSVKKNLSQVNKLTTIKSIHERSSIDEYVNVVAHAVLDSNGVQDMTTKFGMKKKREVLLYDDSGR